MDIEDILYILNGFSWGLVLVEGIQLIAEGPTEVGEMMGMFSYPVAYNIYQSVYSQLPVNVPQLQTAVNNSFQNYINYLSQVQNSAATSFNTFEMTLLIAVFISVFIILLKLLMRLLMPRTEDNPAGY
jgi:ABC-type nitrate/sulfonate/bicarbonate transport system permease component